MSQKKSFVKKGQVYRSLVASALIANGVFQFVAPVLAQTAAGGTINNTATATYEDDDDPNTPAINATSNTVSVTVAEVAGITVVGSGTQLKTDQNGNQELNVGDELYYNYTVTNVGNDPTKFRIPNAPTITGPGEIPAAQFVQVSYDNGANYVNVDTATFETQSIPANGKVLVRVPVRVTNAANTGDTIEVILGNTGDSADTQNQPYADSNNNTDVFTEDNDDGVAGEVDGPPSNGEREASASQEAIVDSDLKAYTFATILKTQDGEATSAGAAGPSDDTISYNLSLRVENSDPTGNGFSPAPLEGTQVPGISANADDKQILVSDAIPAGTVLESVTAPTGGQWQAVYTTDPVTTDANAANWTTTVPSDLNTVTRVGFVRSSSIPADGNVITGFGITVKVSTTTEDSVTVANVAQLFGTSPGNAPVYDESGDQSPSNYNGTEPPAGTDTNGDKIPDQLLEENVDDGYINPTDDDDNGRPDELDTYGSDDGKNNTGTGPGGEALVTLISEKQAISIITGPEGTPEAAFNGDNNQDFTNKSSEVPANTAPGSTIDRRQVTTFTNTVKNDGIASFDALLEPVVTNASGDNIIGDLPAGTIVTVRYNGTDVVYEYNGTDFTAEGGGPKPAPLSIPGVASGQSINYQVLVDLPSGTALSTDTESGFPVPIRSYVADRDNDGNVESENITIDRVYTGYLKLVKKSRILKGTGADVSTEQGDFETTPGADNDVSNDVPRTPALGNIIEYQIEYENISETQSGVGNVILSANNVVITEDGTIGGANGNNWALDNNGDGALDTLNVPNTANAGTETVQFTPSADDERVTKYVVNVTSGVAPGNSGTFTFQRKVNGAAQN